MNVARFAYAMTIVLTWPIECFVTREVIENSIFATKEPQLGRHILITVIIAILTCGISMATDCVEVVLQLNVSFVQCLRSAAMKRSKHRLLEKEFIT